MRRFCERDTIKVAKELLGCYLVNGECVGKIVETEAYLENDEGSHSFKGKTKRNEKMFGEAGRAYVYLIYGMYNCFNVVTNKEGIGEAVLIRALEPVKGIEEMKKRRGKEKVSELCSGPGKLVQAMGISLDDNGKDLSKGKLRIVKGKNKEEIVSAKRIGIVKGTELPYRFYIKGNEFVSRR